MLLTQNSELRRDGIWNWTLPAWVTELDDGRRINVCPQAGACVKVCYARNGTYLFPAVAEAHRRNLQLIVDQPTRWEALMSAELRHDRFLPSMSQRIPGLPREHLSGTVTGLLDSGARAVRIHDSGDFFSDDYTLAWLRIAKLTPHVLFYAYTKEVTRFRRLVAGAAPRNFLWVYSMGGREDHLIDRETERHADVFPDREAIRAAGYFDQDDHDLLAVVAPNHRIGIPANNIPSFNKRLAGRTFGEVEAEQTRHARKPPTGSSG